MRQELQSAASYRNPTKIAYTSQTVLGEAVIAGQPQDVLVSCSTIPMMCCLSLWHKMAALTPGVMTAFQAGKLGRRLGKSEGKRTKGLCQMNSSFLSEKTTDFLGVLSRKLLVPFHWPELGQPAQLAAMGSGR